MSSDEKLSSYTSRVSQLDALILDQEFYNFIKNQLIKIFDKIKLSNWLHIYQPEFDFILSSLVWQLTIGTQQCSIGQKLLGLKYIDSKRSRFLFYCFNVVLPYVNSRIGQYIHRHNYERAIKYTRKIDAGFKVAQVLNFCLFLMENKYLTLSHRLSMLRMIPATQRRPYPPGDSYQIRELLWHQFSDFLLIVIPFINLHLIKRYWSALKNLWTSSNNPKTGVTTAKQLANLNVVAKCCYCNQDAVIPQFLESCSFCYYCLKANQFSEELKCTTCPHN